jgi:hypothetical protein
VSCVGTGQSEDCGRFRDGVESTKESSLSECRSDMRWLGVLDEVRKACFRGI